MTYDIVIEENYTKPSFRRKINNVTFNAIYISYGSMYVIILQDKRSTTGVCTIQ